MSNAALFRLFCVVFSAVSCVVIADTAGKLLTINGVAPFVIAWSRFALATLVLLPFSGLVWRELPNFWDWRVLLRGLLVTLGISCILTALKTEPIANVFGAFFIGPIVSYVLAVVFLGETPSKVRNWLLLVGILGVILVVKPGFGATKGIFLALIAGTAYGTYLAVTRTVAGEFRPKFLLISQLLVGTVILTPIGLSYPLPTLDIYLWFLIAISAGGSAFGNYLLVLASKTAEASLIAPLVYSQLITATFLGVLVFGDWPDLYALVGLGLIFASGVGSLAANRLL